MKNYLQNGVEKLFPDSFVKNINWAYYWINILKSYITYFHSMSSWGLWEYIETKLQNSYKAFLKNKVRSGTSLPASYSLWFLENIILNNIFEHYSGDILLPDQISISDCFNLVKYRVICMYCNCLLTSLWGHEYWN